MHTTRHSAALLGQVDAADYLAVSARTLESWRNRGVGPRYIRVGGRRAYRLCDLDAWVAARVQETGDPHADVA